MQTLRQRIEAVFRGETPDAMVWFGDLTYWYDAHAKIGDLPEKWQGKRGISFSHRQMNIGEYVPGCCAYESVLSDTVETVTHEENGICTRKWHTPAGSLKAVSEYSPVSFSSGHKEYPVKTVEDLKVLRYIAENTGYSPCPEKVAALDKELGDYGLPVVAISGSPVTELSKTWAGLMNFSYLLADNPAEVEKTLAAIAQSQKEMYRITARSECGYVMVNENLSGEAMGGCFNKYAKDYLTEKAAYLHGHNKKVMLHIDGTLRGVVDKVVETGIDCLDAVTPQPVGDVTLDEIRSLTGDDILILGGIPGAMFSRPFTKEDMEAHVKEIIRIHKNSGKFMIGVADQVPPDGDINLVGFVSELIEEYGTY